MQCQCTAVSDCGCQPVSGPCGCTAVSDCGYQDLLTMQCQCTAVSDCGYQDLLTMQCQTPVAVRLFLTVVIRIC